ncbi:MAG: nitroreductase family protein [Chloroflexi bacterium]|nr:nitroreductase family protein [Chloroflexota bacterium]
MDVMEAIRNRRAIRRYRPDPVPEEAIKTLAEAAQWAPSWSNTQTWRLVFVRDPEVKAKVAAAIMTTNPTGINRAARGVGEAPILIAVCAQNDLAGFYRDGPRQGMPSTDKSEYWYMFDAGLAMQNLTLAAHALGLGTVHIGMFNPAEVAKVIGLPSNFVVVELMPLGYPDHNPPAPKRKDLSELMFFDKYGG